MEPSVPSHIADCDFDGDDPATKKALRDLERLVTLADSVLILVAGDRWVMREEFGTSEVAFELTFRGLVYSASYVVVLCHEQTQ